MFESLFHDIAGLLQLIKKRLQDRSWRDYLLLRKKVTETETFAVWPKQEFFTFCGRKLLRMTNFENFRRHELLCWLNFANIELYKWSVFKINKKKSNFYLALFFYFRHSFKTLSLVVNYFRKTLHLRCLTGFWIRLCNL